MQDEDVLGKAYDSRLMRRLITYLRPYKKYVVWAFVLILIDSAFESILPLLTKVTIDTYIRNADFAGLSMIAAAYVALLIFKFLSESFQAYTLSMTGQKIMYD